MSVAAVPVAAAFLFLNAAATVVAVTVAEELVFKTVKPANVKVFPGSNAGKVTSTVSVVAADAPCVIATVGMEFPLTISPTLPLLVAVAVTVLLLLAPVVKPSANVPLKLPLLKVVEEANAETAKAVMPDLRFENAVANSLLLVAADAVKVSPFSVKPCPAAVSAGKVIVVASLFPNALAAAPETPVTPKGLEGGVVSRPKPKSEP